MRDAISMQSACNRAHLIDAKGRREQVEEHLHAMRQSEMRPDSISGGREWVNKCEYRADEAGRVNEGRVQRRFRKVDQP